MKPRPLGRFSSAISQIASVLGYPECARIVGRSESLVRKWADPDVDTLPNLRQCLALDAAYVAGGHGNAPLAGLYLQRLRQSVDKDPRTPPDVVMQTLMIQALTGQLSAAVAIAIDPAGPGGRAITARERDEILRLANEIREDAETLFDGMSALLDPLDA